MSNFNNAKELQSMIAQGQSMEALDKFYADNVQVIEATGEVRDGKEAQRGAIKQWFGMVKEMHDGGCESITCSEDGNTTTAETWVDMTMQNGQRGKMEEVAVQNWQDGKIVKERFYYNVPS